MNGDVPSHAELWEAINQSRMDIAELKGMVSMHFRDGEHHYPPCKAAANMQKTMLSAVGAASSPCWPPWARWSWNWCGGER
jgi:uncharacterized ferritin-like protein (DUF455 family)